MLSLTRKVGQAITIGPDITVYVLEARGQHIKLGLAAPAELRISRVDNPEPQP